MTVYDDRISSYITELFAQEDPELLAIRTTALELGLPDIGISPEEGRFLALLVQAIQARLVIEIGTLAGYSTAADLVGQIGQTCGSCPRQHAAPRAGRPG
jgi:caffeoyl-CoA O-methyltransferase